MVTLTCHKYVRFDHDIQRKYGNRRKGFSMRPKHQIAPGFRLFSTKYDPSTPLRFTSHDHVLTEGDVLAFLRFKNRDRYY